jgi:hypothetical protein
MKHCADDRNNTLLAPVAHRQLVAASIVKVPGMGGVPQGAVGAGMAGGSTSGSEVLCSAAVAHGSSGATTPRSSGLFLPGSSDCTFLSNNWR